MVDLVESGVVGRNMTVIQTPNSDKRQKDAEAEVHNFRNNLGPFVVAADTTRMPMIFTNAAVSGAPVVFANESFLKLTGYTRAEVLGENFMSLFEQGCDAATVDKVRMALARPTETDIELQFRRRNGSRFWASLFITQVVDETGKVVQHFISLMDFTKHRDEETRCQMLINELNHRVKNSLATVQAIVMATPTNADATTFRKSIESRIFALSRSHDLLTREKWEKVGLRDLLEVVLAPFKLNDTLSKRIIFQGDNVPLSPKEALVFGITFHELVTNAFKFGALANETGLVLLEWRATIGTEGNQLVIEWTEKNGPLVTSPARKGFGMNMIERGATHELGGTVHIDYAAGGLICAISIPWSADQS